MKPDITPTKDKTTAAVDEVARGRPSAVSRPTIGLMMIVRNESAVLARLAASVSSQVDHWTIVDTGSTDDTTDVVRELFAAVPGELIEDEWRGYGPSRNVALEAAEPHSDWLLTLDADETLDGTIDGSPLDSGVDGISAEQRSMGVRYWLPRLVRSGVGWRWWGRAHECLQLENGTATVAPTSSFWVVHHHDGGNRTTKYERELALLQEDWEERPGDPRTAFYIARTYDDTGATGQAINWYRQRLEIGGWEEESFFSRLRLGECLLGAGLDDEGCGVLWRAWGERPYRAEPLITLADHYQARGAWALAWRACTTAYEHCEVKPRDPARPTKSRPASDDTLFVDLEAYEWRWAYQASICAWYVDERELGLRLVQYLLARDDLPRPIRESVIANRRVYLDS